MMYSICRRKCSKWMICVWNFTIEKQLSAGCLLCIYHYETLGVEATGVDLFNILQDSCGRLQVKGKCFSHEFYGRIYKVKQVIQLSKCMLQSYSWVHEMYKFWIGGSTMQWQLSVPGILKALIGDVTWCKKNHCKSCIY